MKRIIFLLLIITFSLSSIAQNYKIKNADNSFIHFKEIAHSGKYIEAQDSLGILLNQFPQYTDAKILFAKTLAWQKKYIDARNRIKPLLKTNNDYKDVWLTAIDIERWSKNKLSADSLSKQSLLIFPMDRDILMKRARILESLGKENEAIKTVDEILNKNPQDNEASLYKIRLRSYSAANTIGASASTEHYSKIFDPVQFYYLEFSNKTKFGTVIARVNMKNRFGDTGFQFEADAYPQLSKSLYAYLNYGYSNSYLYPKHRMGAELFKAFAKKYEASIGIRLLDFGKTTKIYTGSIAYYHKNYYFSLRPYIIENQNATDYSGVFKARKYLKNAQNYFEMNIGFGFSPETQSSVGGGLTNQNPSLNSQRFGLDYQFTTGKRFIWRPNLLIKRQELSFNPDEYMYIYTFGLILKWRYK